MRDIIIRSATIAKESGFIPFVQSSFVARQFCPKVLTVTDLRVEADKDQLGYQCGKIGRAHV